MAPMRKREEPMVGKKEFLEKVDGTPWTVWALARGAEASVVETFLIELGGSGWSHDGQGDPGDASTRSSRNLFCI